MTEAALIRWLTIIVTRSICVAGPFVMAACIIGTLVMLDASRSSTSLLEREWECELWRSQLREMEKQADHKRSLEIIEALRPRRDMSLPAEPSENF